MAIQRPGAAGFTYIGVVLMTAVMGLAALATVKVGSVVERRAAEEELLAIGTEFREAFISYANATPPGLPRTPPSLQALLKDPRFPEPRRHLRQIYPDPLTGEDVWGTVAAIPGPGIMGVYSNAPGKPIKIGNFDLRFQDFQGKTSYAEWRFGAPAEVITPAVSTVAAPGTQPPPAAPARPGVSRP